MRRISWASRFAMAWALALLPSIALPSIAFASPEGGHGGGGLGDIEWVALQPDDHGRVGFLWVIVNFVVLLIVLNKLLFSKLSAGHKRNREQIKGELERATKARTEAESLMAEYEDKLVKLKSEVEDIREAAKKPKVRRKTRPTPASQRRRLESKRRRSELKRMRQTDWDGHG